MGLPRKEYYRIAEVAGDLGCPVQDVIHHFLHDLIRLGIRVHDELVYGMNADGQTVGIYYVNGVLTIPKVCAAEKEWEFGASDIAEAGGLLIEPDYPPDIKEASHIAEDSVPPAFWAWAPGRDWDHPETDHSRIERFCVGFTGIDESDNPIFDWRAINPARLVIHAVERERLLCMGMAEVHPAAQFEQPTPPSVIACMTETVRAPRVVARIRVIVDAIAKTGYPPMAIPYGGKTEIKQHYLRNR